MQQQVDDYLLASRKHGELTAKSNWLKCISHDTNSRGITRMAGLIAISQRGLLKQINNLGIFLTEAEIHQVKSRGAHHSTLGREEMEVRIEREYRPLHVVMDIGALCNTTGYSIPDDIALGLSWGPKFTFPFILNANNIAGYLAQLEYTIEEVIPTALYDQVFREISHHISAGDKIVHDQQLQWLLFLKYRLDRFLGEHKDIVVALADKGKVVVLMELEQYKTKTLEHLNDLEHYQPISYNPLPDLVVEEMALLNQLRGIDKIRDMIGSYQDKCMLLPKFYATIKIHKNNKIRPITSNAGDTVGATLNRFFNIILTYVFPAKPLHYKNAKEVKEAITKLNLSRDDVMVSYDAVSMFTSIPTSLILQIIGTNTDRFTKAFGFTKELTMGIADFLLNRCTFFTAFNQIYQQKHGIPMGGAISPICCRIVMDHILDRVLQIIPQPTFLCVYVDDSLFIIKDNAVDLTLNALNSVNPHIQFTYELEYAGTLNFLNLTLFRGLNNVQTNWYKKPSSSDRLLNFFSSHKRSTVINTAKQYIRTMVELNDSNLFGSNREKIIKTLRLNCFPETLIITLIQENFTSLRSVPPGTSNTEDVTYVSFPHQINNGGVKSIIRKYKTSQSVLAESIKNNKINHIRLIKTPTPRELKSNMILTSECQCKQRIKVEMTKFNETGLTLRNRMINGFGQCNDKMHFFGEVSYHGGLHTRRQTLKLCNILQWRHRDRLLGTNFQFPNRYLRKHIYN